MPKGKRKRKHPQTADYHSDNDFPATGAVVYRIKVPWNWCFPVRRTSFILKNDQDQGFSVSTVCCGQASEGGERRKSAMGSDEVRLLETLRSNFPPYPRKPRNVRHKRKVEIHGSSTCCTRQSRRLKRVAAQKFGRLDSKKFEFYMEDIWRSSTAHAKNACTYFDCLWFSLYTKRQQKEKILSWIRRADVFSKKYVFIPIVQWSHWFLLIFCHFDESPESTTNSRCMLLLDSLQQANCKQLEPGIRRFVFDIFKIEERPEKKQLIDKIPLLVPKVPQQMNGEECGYYVLYYMSLFLKQAPESFNISKGYPYFMKEDWFTAEEVERFIRQLNEICRPPLV